MSDDEITLSSHALAALMDFKNEEEERIRKFESLKEDAENEFDKNKEIKEQGMNLFKEDWQLSQFWYDDETSNILAQELLKDSNKDTIIVIVSAPSVYAAMKKLEDDWPTQHIYLLEFDERFKVLAGDHFYLFDYNKPNELSTKLINKADKVLADPPFIEYDCQLKTSQAVKNLIKSNDSKFITCTGERVKEHLLEFYKDLGLKQTTFLPKHSNGLSNEFLCYSNFASESWEFVQN